MNIFIFSCLAFMLGCFCGITYDAVIILSYSINCLFAFGIKCTVFKLREMSNLYILAVFIMFLTGAVTGFAYEKAAFKKYIPMYGKNISVSGTVSDINKNSFRLDTDDESYYVYYPSYEANFSNNSTVTVNGSLMPYSKPPYRGAFNTRIYNAIAGVYGQIDADKVEVTGYNNRVTLKGISAKMRAFIEQKTDSVQTGDTAGFLKAMLTGNTENMSDEMKDKFRVTGIYHLISVSGLHFSIFISFFALASGVFKRRKILNLIFNLAIVLFYAFFIGEKAPVIRCAIMMLIGFMLSVFRRRSDALTNLTVAGMAICFINPFYMADASFQMSFLATLGIVMFADKFKHKLIAVPLIASLFMLPVTLYYSNVLSIDGIMVNILTVAFSPIIIVLGYISCFVPVVGIPVRILSEVIMFIISFFADVDFFHITIASPNAYVFIIWFLLISIVYFAVNGFMVDDMFMSLMCVFLILAHISTLPDKSRHIAVRFINTGSYNMEHIITENKRDIFIDCGYGAYDYLIKNGIDKIDAIWITDNKTSLYRELESVCENFEVSQVLLPDSMRKSKLNLEKVDVMYYNQNSYRANADGIKFIYKTTDNGSLLQMRAMDSEITIPINTKSIGDINATEILCIPDECVDSGIIDSKNIARYYIHSTCRYDYYDDGGKYITAQSGMITVKLYPNKIPRIQR